MRAGGFWVRFACVALAAGAFLGASCTLDEQATPDLTGPADTGISVELVAAPDVVNADGVSQSVVRLVLRDQNGRGLSGRSVLFSHDGDGYVAPAVGSIFVGPVQSGLVMSTDRDGVTFVNYVAGTQVRALTMWVRPYGFDTALTWERSVEIQQR